MDVPGQVPESINCHACGGPIELTGHKEFTQVGCPRCHAESVVPLQFGNFLLLSPLGVGGMGTVYKAMDLSLNRFLALKILRQKLASKPEFIESFSREARAAAAVNHPNIAQVYSFGDHQGQYYLAMELLERGSLDDRMATLGRVPEKDVLQIGVQVAAGLRAAYQRGLLHRDVKPGNILFNDEGLPKIVDFGLARAQQPESAAAAASTEPIWGTPYYIAPEKLRGQPEDWRSDMYSLGASLFHALAGRPPFDAATASEVVTKHATQPAFSLRTYAPATHQYTAQVIARMLSKNPAERYESYDALIHDLNAALKIVSAAESVTTVVAPSGEQIPLGAIIGTAAAVVVCIVVVWVVWRNRVSIFHLEPGPPPTVERTGPPAPPPPGPPPAPPVASDVVDFNENAAWVKSWNNAMAQLAEGRHIEALHDYGVMLKELPGNPSKARKWAHYFSGFAYLLANAPDDARAEFEAVVESAPPPAVFEPAKTGTFVETLANVMIGKLATEKLEEALPRLPAWAAGLSEFTLGFKHLQAGDLSAAAQAFRRYKSRPPDPQQRWAFALQPLADRFAGQCDEATRALVDMGKLADQGKPAEALTLLKAALAKASLSQVQALLQKQETALTQALARQRELQSQAHQDEERRRQQQADAERHRAEEETRRAGALEPELKPFWDKYDFKGALGKCAAIQASLKTDAGRQALEPRLAAARWLNEFKTKLAADFSRQPYARGDLQSRTQVPLSEKLMRASDTDLVFAAKYGEIIIPWTDLPPAELVKLAAFYSAAAARTEKPDALARRALALAVFCRQYGRESAATGYTQQARQLDPALQPEIETIFGKPPAP